MGEYPLLIINFYFFIIIDWFIGMKSADTIPDNVLKEYEHVFKIKSVCQFEFEYVFNVFNYY